MGGGTSLHHRRRLRERGGARPRCRVQPQHRPNQRQERVVDQGAGRSAPLARENLDGGRVGERVHAVAQRKQHAAQRPYVCWWAEPEPIVQIAELRRAVHWRRVGANPFLELHAPSPVQIRRQHPSRLTLRRLSRRAKVAQRKLWRRARTACHRRGDEHILDLDVEVGDSLAVHVCQRGGDVLEGAKLGERLHRRRGGVLPQVTAAGKGKQREKLLRAVLPPFVRVAKQGKEVVVPEGAVDLELARRRRRTLPVRRQAGRWAALR
mmetsp:Transcript_22012/g.70244  ORF Transcript_22012/g.70244 Transcript_22012/m.70244 type:complete len:265 (+) Transcript_22012:147-941(+)